jgi:phenylalanine-4-hydroxylase
MEQGRNRYSPVLTTAEGQVRVELAEDHPGLCDPVYRRRRDELAALAARWQPGDPLPEPRYTVEEHEVWAQVMAALEPLHDKHACSAYLEGKAALDLPPDRVPQLSELSRALSPLCGFRYQPVAGLAPLRDFYGSFAAGTFWSTQYLRHPSVPLYTPEPDVIHELVGHANQLAAPGLAGLYRLFGLAVQRSTSEEALKFLSTVFWYTMEFGVVRERGAVRAIGAGILSSVAETATFGQATLLPADPWAMSETAYDITALQPVLYLWPSQAALEDGLQEFLDGFDDERWASRPRPAN